MSWLTTFFSREKKTTATKHLYESIVDFVDDNVSEVKQLLSSVGYNDRHKRLSDLATMSGCQVMMLCAKNKGVDKFTVVDTSNVNYSPIGTTFLWQHNQAAASMNAASVFTTLPFQNIGAIGFISVPIKNSRNVLVGILLGITSEYIVNIDASTRLMHIMSHLFEPELAYEELKRDKVQYEQRIASLNQSIEILNKDLNNERQRSIESKELRSAFLTNLSQDIRTPMNAIIGFTELLASTEDEKERQDFIEIVRQTSYSLLKAIDNLVEMSKLQANYMFRPSCPHQLNELLNDLKKRYEGKLKQLDKKVEIVTSYAYETPNDTIWNSDEIITKAFEQLLDNACKYTESGTITFGYSMTQSEANFFIADTGCGIKENDDESLFNMFNTPSQDGQMNQSGVGLAVARKYVELANGKLWLDRTYNRGARFIFSIPKEKL